LISHLFVRASINGARVCFHAVLSVWVTNCRTLQNTLSCSLRVAFTFASEVFAQNEAHHDRSFRHCKIAVLLGLNLNPTYVRYIAPKDN
jgi:hypothetical protein